MLNISESFWSCALARKMRSSTILKPRRSTILISPSDIRLGLKSHIKTVKPRAHSAWFVSSKWAKVKNDTLWMVSSDNSGNQLYTITLEQMRAKEKKPKIITDHVEDYLFDSDRLIVLKTGGTVMIASHAIPLNIKIDHWCSLGKVGTQWVVAGGWNEEEKEIHLVLINIRSCSIMDKQVYHMSFEIELHRWACKTWSINILRWSTTVHHVDIETETRSVLLLRREMLVCC